MSVHVSAAAAEFVSTGGELAALIAAGAFAALSLVGMYVLFRVSKTVDATTQTIKDVTARTGPMLDNANATIENVNTALRQVQTSLDGVNVQLERVDSITGHAQQVTGNVANVTNLVTAAATSPLVKMAAFGFGLRKAVAKRRGEEEEVEVRQTLRDKKTRRKRGR
ncbi:MAG TPA: DUF948 domain-containing protein [Stackebrandtia sp.]|uniref:DUF948 domain-containing protein n=1 Tax=Stackebrandtia sp. TaxID=2023065 RepID=UPI002D337E9D|nr:DUF948 domain-containing protein [Stackebrandtia sp.]HZE39720.1 DUF948 domain-containing protein [Stackebrandtia sp.]